MTRWRGQWPRADLRALLGAWFLLGAVRWAIMVALAVYAFAHDGTGGVGLITAARLLPATLATPVLAGLIDRGERRRVVLGAAVLSALCLLATGLAMAGSGSLALPAVLSALAGVLAVPLRPGLQTLMPALAATPEELTVATAAWGASDNAGFLIGGGLGGVALAVVAPAVVVLAAAGAGLVAVLLVARLPRVGVTALVDIADEEMPDLSGLRAGVRVVRAQAGLWVPLVLLAGLLMLEGTTDVQLVALAIGPLRMGGGGPGVLFVVWAVGGVLSSVVTLALVRRRGYGLVLLAGGLLFAVTLAVSGAGGVALAVAAMLPVGLGFALVETGVMAVIPRLADDAVVGRVYGLSELIYSGAAGLGGVLAPGLISLFGVSGSLAVVGAGYGALVALCAGFCTRLDSGEAEASSVRELLRGVGFLSPLPLPQLERLVRSSRSASFPAGALVIRAGDPGEDFYLVESGSVEVVEFGRRMGRGEGFGEIALLRDVPRTATIRAAETLHVRTLSRTVFLAAVRGHSDARQLADAVVDSRLGGRSAPAAEDRLGP